MYDVNLGLRAHVVFFFYFGFNHHVCFFFTAIPLLVMFLFWPLGKNDS